MKLRYLLIVSLIFTGCTKNIWVMTTSKDDKPITSCLKFSPEIAMSIAVPMNCQKSVVIGKYLCSNGRMLHFFTDNQECLELYEFFKKTQGEYRISEDPTDIR
ncbi:hypothetical protein BDW_07805 [Bdellovibrio bacteriovorus W]|nr:hypothetical protein BDW_07805 [Bdellovibrio bacteriovorus W]